MGRRKTTEEIRVKPDVPITQMLYEIRTGRYGTPDEVIQHDYKKYKLKRS